MHYSFSQLKMFMECPYAYYKNYVAGDKKLTTERAVLFAGGTHNHDEIYEHLKAGNMDALPDRLVKLVEGADVELEKKVEIDIYGRNYLGYIDIVLRTPYGITLVDLKSFMLPDDFLQLVGYSIYFFKADPSLEEVRLIYFSIKQNIYRSTVVTRDIAEQTESEILQTIKQIEMAHEMDYWERQPSTACETCAYTEECYNTLLANVDLTKVELKTQEDLEKAISAVVMADAMSKKVKKAIKDKMLDEGMFELNVGTSRAYLSNTISLKFGKAK